MFNVIGILVLMRLSAAWEPCGLPAGCYCSVPVLHAINCRNITVFPIFEDVIKPGVLSITISDSEIIRLPPFKKGDWDRLRRVVFINTPMLDCGTIAEIRRPGLDILSECELKKHCEHRHENSIYLGLTSTLLLLLLTISIGCIVYMYRERKRTVSDRVGM